MTLRRALFGALRLAQRAARAYWRALTTPLTDDERTDLWTL